MVKLAGQGSLRSFLLAAMVFLLIPALACSTNSTEPATTPPDSFATYASFLAHLEAAAALESAEDRTAALDTIWDSLRQDRRFPFVDKQSVAFLYRGAASSVSVAGDFNGWKPTAGPARKLGLSNVWLREETFPLDARLDYKLVVNGSTWLLDPENAQVQRGGFGDNSELRMPGYVPSPWVERASGTPGGELRPADTLLSNALGYTVNYRVYLPNGYETHVNLPVIYVTDGHEYADDIMGSMVIVLDNLIAAENIPPVMAVFIDPRVAGQNRRSEQYQMNPAFASFVAHELVPVIDAAYPTNPDRGARAILGTSLGGLNAAYFAVEDPETWGLIGVQSPAFQAAGGAIVPRYQSEPAAEVRMFLSWGTFHDFGEATLQMRDLLDAKGYSYHHVLVNEGHSWGNWRALLDDLLVYFWGDG